VDSRIVGVGMTQFTRQPARTPASLAVEAVKATLADAGASWDQVDAIFVGSALLHQGVGQRLLMGTPLLGKPIVNVENACASSGTAMREGLAWLEAGFARAVLVIGVETLTRMSGTVLAPPEEDLAGYLGGTFATAYALKARRHMEVHGLTREEMAAVTVKSRNQAKHNAYAHFRQPMTIDQVLAEPLIADPLTRSQCCPNVDGAAAALLVRGDALDEYSNSGVRIVASAMVSGKRRDHQDAEWDATRRAARAAYESSGIGPEDVDVVEVHDAFTIGEIIHYEDLGLCPPGEGGKYAATGMAAVGGGGTPVNAGGGLLSRGHPLGASGLAQIFELTQQLRGAAGAYQVEGARTALAHIMGGNVSELDSNACAVHILQAA